MPLLGLIPILGRLFTAPTRDNRQIDIVIAVTPRVIRAPAILPEDEVERSTGSLAVPTNSSLEAMVVEEDRQDLLAAARRIPNASEVQLPDQTAEAPAYVKTDNTVTSGTTETAKAVETGNPILKPIDNSVKTLQLNQTADTTGTADISEIKQPLVDSSSASTVSLKFGADLPDMKAGDKVKVPVLIDSTGKFRSAVIGLKFDSKKVAIRSVLFGDVFGPDMMSTAATPFLNQKGKMYISLTAKGTADANAIGILAYIEIEALTNGKPQIAFDRDVLNFLTSDGKNFTVKYDK